MYIYDAAYKRFADSSGKRSSIIQAQCSRPLYVPRTEWAENIANAWLPYTNIWETLGGISPIFPCNLVIIIFTSRVPIRNEQI